MRDFRFAKEDDNEPNEDALDREHPDDEEAEGDAGIDDDAVLELALKGNAAVKAALLAFKAGDPDRIRLLRIAERLQGRLRKLNEQMEAADG